ncbi:MAG: glutathione-regulated potassium-efflux system protein KefC [Pseudomonadota bacterium]
MATDGLMMNAAIYLGAAVVSVPLAKRLGLGPVLGYLIAGVIIGPSMLGLIKNPETILHFAEFGVVLLLFLIGLELHPHRLWAMRKPIIGLGGAQVGLSALLLFGAALLGMETNAAVVTALGLALSSTAIAVQSLKEKDLLTSHSGASAFSVLLFQDIAVIPILALIPVLAGGDTTQEGAIWFNTLKVLGVIGAVVIIGHYLTRPLFRFVAATRMREIFTASALLLVIGISLLMEMAGISMALGAFLAGVLLADSEYRHELEVEIEPFKGLLLGLFFIAVGMSIDLRLLLSQPLLIAGLVTGLIVIKSLVLIGLGKITGIPAGQRVLFAFMLGQGGEFAFVIFTVAFGAGLLSPETKTLLILVVALSMLLTPLLLLMEEYWISPRFYHQDDTPEQEDEVDSAEHGNPVVIVGFGRFGRLIGRLLHANGIGTTVLDMDPEEIDQARRYGYKVYFGDASRMETLRRAGIEQAKLLILAVGDPEYGLRLTQRVHETFPSLPILARAYDGLHAFELKKLGVTGFEREVREGALTLGGEALRKLGYGAYQARMAVNRFRDHDVELFRRLYQNEEVEKRISITREARDELEKVFAADKASAILHDGQEWREPIQNEEPPK